MRITIIFILAIATIMSDDFSIDAYIMGKSYHSNRYIKYNEKNPGLGIGLNYTSPENPDVDITINAGFYKDSYYETAKYCLIGPRVVFGNREKFHSTIGASIGYFEGSEFNGVGLLPSVSFGYNIVDICFTGYPDFSNNYKEGSTNPKENRQAPGGFIAAFLKIRLMTF